MNKTAIIKEQQDELEQMKKDRDLFLERIKELEKEKKEILDGNDVVSKADYNNLIKQMQRETDLKTNWQLLYEKERVKRTDLNDRYRTEKRQEQTYSDVKCTTEYEAACERIRELEVQLQEEKDKHSRKGTGRKRNNETSDEKVVSLRRKGETVKSINEITRLSSATINRILKNFKT